MKTISKCENRKVMFSGVEEGRAIICEYESFTINGHRKWDKTVMSLTLEELRRILSLVEESSQQ